MPGTLLGLDPLRQTGYGVCLVTVARRAERGWLCPVVGTSGRRRVVIKDVVRGLSPPA
jgi:hypothetical protein